MRVASVAVVMGAIVLATGCATGRGKAPGYTLVDGSDVHVGNALTVVPTRPWTSRKVGNIETWTVDGFSLERLVFYTNVADGQPIVPTGARPVPPPPFSKSMTDVDLMDLALATFFPREAAPSDLHDVQFGAVPGFRFDVRYQLQNGLERRAHIAGAIVHDHLQLIVYDAAALHYYEHYWPDVDGLLGSLRFQ